MLVTSLAADPRHAAFAAALVVPGLPQPDPKRHRQDPTPPVKVGQPPGDQRLTCQSPSSEAPAALDLPRQKRGIVCSSWSCLLLIRLGPAPISCQRLCMLRVSLGLIYAAPDQAAMLPGSPGPSMKPGSPQRILGILYCMSCMRYWGSNPHSQDRACAETQDQSGKRRPAPPCNPRVHDRGQGPFPGSFASTFLARSGRHHRSSSGPRGASKWRSPRSHPARQWRGCWARR